ILQVHEAQVGLDRYRRPPNRAGKTRNERLQESLIVEKLIHRRQLRRQRPHLCRHHRVEQLRLTVAQPEHQSLLGRELDREQRRTRSSIVPADASLRRIVFQGDVARFFSRTTIGISREVSFCCWSRYSISFASSVRSAGSATRALT